MVMMDDPYKLPPLTDEQIQAGARPGESWDEARRRLEAANWACPVPRVDVHAGADYTLAGPVDECIGLDGRQIEWEPGELTRNSTMARNSDNSLWLDGSELKAIFPDGSQVAVATVEPINTDMPDEQGDATRTQWRITDVFVPVSWPGPMPDYQGFEPAPCEVQTIIRELESGIWESLGEQVREWVTGRLMPSMARYGVYPPPSESGGAPSSTKPK